MGRRITRERRPSREDKIRSDKGRPVSKFEEANPRTIRLEPKNSNQRRAIELLDGGVPVVFLMGSAGTGKSFLAAYRVAKLLNSKSVSKIFLIRPAVGVGKSIGLLPGEIEEKMAPYFAQTIAHLETFLGKGAVANYLDNKAIEMKPAEYMRGMSFENCVALVEEGQNFTHEEFEMVLTRIGENCQLIVTGDTKQNDLKVKSGMDTTIDLVNQMLQTHPEYMKHDDLDALDESIGVVRFQPNDVVRSGLTRALVKMYFNN